MLYAFKVLVLFLSFFFSECEDFAVVADIA